MRDIALIVIEYMTPARYVLDLRFFAFNNMFFCQWKSLFIIPPVSVEENRNWNGPREDEFPWAEQPRHGLPAIASYIERIHEEVS
jgi:hypothetical protein